MQKLVQIASVIMVFIVIINITLLAFSKINIWLFWLILALAAIYAYWILPKIKKR